MQEGSTNYCTRIVSDLGQIGAERWNAVLSHEAANPFVRYEFLQALQASGCAAERTGWEPRHLTLWSGTELKAAAPLYRKHHSYGEYVFDWAWADAHQRHGRCSGMPRRPACPRCMRSSFPRPMPRGSLRWVR